MAFSWSCIPPKVLPTSDCVPEQIVLRADAHAAIYLVNVCRYVNPFHNSGSSCRLQESNKHIQDCRLSCTVGSQESKDLTSMNGKVQVVHGHLQGSTQKQ